MIKLILSILMIAVLSGCATPGIKGTETKDTLTIEPVANTGFLSWLFPAKLPAGDYEYQVSEHKKLKMNTKTELKLIDLDMNAVKDN